MWPIGVFVFILAFKVARASNSSMHHVHTRGIVVEGDLQASYDYIVVGGGLAGLVLASRLSEDSSTSVLVLEAGLSGNDVTSEINPPAGAYYSSIVGTDYDWQHVTMPQPHLGNRSIGWPRGKVLGGSSAMNAMYLVRPSRTELDAWDALARNFEDSNVTTEGGDWSWDSMYAYMKKSENFTEPSPELATYVNISYDAAAHGAGGPMQVSYPAMMIEIVSNWTSSLELVEVPSLAAPNGGTTLGGFIAPSSINPANWTRSYSRSAYIDPLPPRSNLHILADATVIRIVFAEGSDASGRLIARGIEFAQNAAAPRRLIGVDREVILAGGPLGSPKLLMQSGVGPKDVLENASVPLTLELPGVGQHLQDHLTAGVVWETLFETAGDIYNTGSDFSKTSEFLSCINDAVAFVNATVLFSGPATQFQSEILAAFSTSSETLVPSQYPEVVEGYKAIYNTTATALFPDVAQLEMLMSIMSPSVVSIQAAVQHPYSQGRVYINSNNPFDPLSIDPQYFSHFADLVLMRQGIKLVRSVGAAFGANLGTEIAPGVDIQTDDQIDAWLVEGGASSQYHPTGTCAMLPREQGGVVDTNLLVYGLANVRVADSSVFPLEFAAHLASATYGVAEQAAVLLKNTSYIVPVFDTSISRAELSIPSYVLAYLATTFLIFTSIL